MPHLIGKFMTVVLMMTVTATVFAAERAGTVLITGANRGVGLAMAETFSKAGYSVIGTARKPAAATALQNLQVRVVQLDVTDPDSVAGLARQLDNEPIDILINNAGIFSKEAAEFSDVDIERLATEYQVLTPWVLCV